MPKVKEDPEDLKLLVGLLRLVGGMNKTELAEKSGVSRSLLSLAEQAEVGSTRRTLERLARAVDVPVELLKPVLVLLRAFRRTRGVSLSERIERLARRADKAGDEGMEVLRSAALLLLSGSLSAERDDLPKEEVRRTARDAWSRIATLSVEQQRRVIPEFSDLRTWGAVEVVCEESADAAADDVDRSREFAELALFIADHLPQRQRDQAQGYAWGFVANARRVGSELQEAEAAFEVSDRLWREGPSPLDGSRLLDLKASLRKDQRLLKEALDLLAEAERTPDLSPLSRARILVKRANILKLQEDFEGAIRALREAAPTIEGSQNVRLLSTLRFGLVLNLCHLGRAAEAEAGLPGVRALAAQTGKRLDQLRLRWLEGKVAAGLGRIPEAIEALSRVRAEFAELTLHYDAALAMVELAELYLQIGRTAEVKALTRLSAPLFVSKGVHEEARKALALFRQAAERETVTLKLARRLATYLYRAQSDPTLRFEASPRA